MLRLIPSRHCPPESVCRLRNKSSDLLYWCSKSVGLKVFDSVFKMDEESSSGCQLRRRRCLGNRRLALNLDVGFQINEGSSNSQGTPSPSYARLTPSAVPSSARLLQDFKNKQQSFDIQVEDCEEIEIIIESDEECDEEENATATVPNRPVTPTPVQDFGTSVLYLEGPQATDFLKVKTIEQDCYTDVSDAGSDDEDEQ